MNKLLIGLLLGLVALGVGTVYATYQPTNLGWVTLSHSSGTVTEIVNSTAPTIGYPRWCTNCTANGGQGTLCTSTGTARFNQFILSTGTVCR